MQFNLKKQYRIIRDPNNPEATDVPSMSLVMALDNGIVGEADSIYGLMGILIGNVYFDAEDALDEWYHRLFQARKEAMKALAHNINAVVYDSRKGAIKNNYAADIEDSDYEIGADEGEFEKIRIENDRLFLLSLLKLRSFIILEREDSFQLRPHKKWEAIQRDKTLQNCGSCQHKIKDPGNSGAFCKVYQAEVDPLDGNKCGSYTFIIEDATDSQGQKEYFDISAAYDVEALIQMHGKHF